MTWLAATQTEESRFVARARSIYLSIYSISLCDSVTEFVSKLCPLRFQAALAGSPWHRGTQPTVNLCEEDLEGSPPVTVPGAELRALLRVTSCVPPCTAGLQGLAQYIKAPIRVRSPVKKTGK